MQIRQLFRMLVVTVVLLAVSGCQRFSASASVSDPASKHAIAASVPVPVAGPIDKVDGIDGSDSITEKQRSEWESALRADVMSLRPRDRLRIFAIGSQTANSIPFFDRVFPEACPEGAEIAILVDCAQSVVRFRQEALAAISRALHPDSASKITDVFSLFDRIHGDPGHSLEVNIFSDGLNATPELNMERVRLNRSNFAPVIARVFSRHGWTPTTLAGGKVQFVVPSLEEGDKYQGVNDRHTLNAFYTELVSKLGGEMTNFETQKGGQK